MRHTAVWPEMLQALKATGWNSYSEVFNLEDQLAALDAAPTEGSSS